MFDEIETIEKIKPADRSTILQSLLVIKQSHL